MFIVVVLMLHVGEFRSFPVAQSLSAVNASYDSSADNVGNSVRMSDVKLREAASISSKMTVLTENGSED